MQALLYQAGFTHRQDIVLPERDSAIGGHLDPVELHDDVIGLQVLGGLVGGLDVAHQDALLVGLHGVGGAQGVGLHALPADAQHGEACEGGIAPVRSSGHLLPTCTPPLTAQPRAMTSLLAGDNFALLGVVGAKPMRGGAPLCSHAAMCERHAHCFSQHTHCNLLPDCHHAH